MKKITLIFLFYCFANVKAQITFPTNGAPNPNHNVYVFTHATIFADAETVLKDATLIFKDGKILNVGEKIEIPKEAVVTDLKGKYIYPSFIDLFCDYGLGDYKFQKKIVHAPQMESNVKGAFGWNQAIRAYYEAHKHFSNNQEKADEFRKNGIGTVLSSMQDGIVRGSGVLVNLSNKNENETVIIDRAAGFYSFNKGSSTQDYPSSLTGAIALLRQTHLDAQWYANSKNKDEYNITLKEFNSLQNIPSIFEVNDKYNVLRAARLGNEFKINYIIKAGGNEYQRINEIKNTGLKFILPLNFPEPYDVEDIYDAESISLAELKHWELAPTNPAAFEKNNIPFCLTSFSLKDKNSFLKNIRKAIEYGLSEKAALKALTQNPASFINAQDKIGALKKGLYANFFISSKPIFNEDAKILQHYIAGELNYYFPLETNDMRGNYQLKVSSKTYSVKISGDIIKPKSIITIDTSRKIFNYSINNNIFSFDFSTDSLDKIRGEGSFNSLQKSSDGNAQLSNGELVSYQFRFTSNVDTVQKVKPVKKHELNLGKIIYPFSAYGEPLPEEQGTFKDLWNKFKSRYSAILIKDATVWTNEGDTVLKEYDVFIVEGKIVRIAPNIDVPTTAFAKIIDAKGMHLTAGIIDEHNHIALTSGVNEGAQASSAEVRMGDVINPEDINIYRQLSGGVTCAQLLHGSANPIGGQSVLIKLRWGHSAEELKYENADGFIKFALGENVKQSNWGDVNVVRFPQSRMGVEQVYVDFFTRAKEYDKQFSSAKNSPDKNLINSFRRDFELEALAEILNKKRFITCHSYVQSEINMLMKVADSMGFKVNTFTHILEGYKVADKMKAHGANASTFSDWWAYKMEVMEAIPYNSALMTKVGVNTAVNSDDAEMARRLNQEAAKAVKYGALTETEALKLATLNPAKMLHIDDKVGSIRVGKVADLALWTGHPLSVYSKVDKTIIDGKIYFDREQDLKLREEIRKERARIISKLLNEKQKGSKTVKHESKEQRLYHCNTIEGVNENKTGIR